MKRLNVVFWYDKELVASEVFTRRIQEEIDKADIAVLIVSQPFLNSEFIEKFELPRIRARAERRELAVVPVLVEPCSWDEYEFSCERQILPRKPTPLINYTEREADWAQVNFDLLDGIKKLVKKIRADRAQAGELRKHDGNRPRPVPKRRRPKPRLAKRPNPTERQRKENSGRRPAPRLQRKQRRRRTARKRSARTTSLFPVVPATSTHRRWPRQSTARSSSTCPRAGRRSQSPSPVATPPAPVAPASNTSNATARRNESGSAEAARHAAEFETVRAKASLGRVSPPEGC
jgi:hypothetical protein